MAKETTAGGMGVSTGTVLKMPIRLALERKAKAEERTLSATIALILRKYVEGEQASA